jgi:hypothetical protein
VRRIIDISWIEMISNLDLRIGMSQEEVAVKIKRRNTYADDGGALDHKPEEIEIRGRRR